MSDKDDGGQAFPLPINQYGEIPRLNKGMTLRDWFAGQALAGYIASTASPHASGPSSISGADASKVCYQLADAMLAERSK